MASSLRAALALSLTVVALAAPAPALAVDIDVDVRLPGVRIHIGDRDPRGRYWDGKLWREETWWHANCRRLHDRREFRGDCVPPRAKRRHCPPGQAKKGLC